MRTVPECPEQHDCIGPAKNQYPTLCHLGPAEHCLNRIGVARIFETVRRCLTAHRYHITKAVILNSLPERSRRNVKDLLFRLRRRSFVSLRMTSLYSGVPSGWLTFRFSAMLLSP